MKKVLLAAGLALALAGCNTNIDPNVATPNQVVIAINAYNTAVVAGTAYLRLPLCLPALVLPCRTQGLSQNIYSALRAGRAARKVLLDDLANNVTAPITALQTLEAAYAVVKQIPQQ